MKNQLQLFEQLIERIILLQKDSIILNSNHLKFRDDLFMGKQRLRDGRDDLIFSQFPSEYIQRLLGVYHVRLVKLSNKVYGIIKQNGTVQNNDTQKNLPPADLLIRAVLAIDELLQSSIVIWPGKFDTELVLADYNLDVKGAELRWKYEELFRVMKKSGVHDHLLQILKHFFQEFESTRSRNVTYSQIKYAEMLFQAVKSMIDEFKAADWTEKLWERFVSMNFNHERVFQFAKTWIFLNAISDRPEDQHLDELTRLHSKLNGIVLQNGSYQSEYISLKMHTEMLLDYEIDVLEKMQNRLAKDLSVKEGNFIVIDLTVKQLNLWAHINVLLKRIPYHTPIQVARVLTIFVKTLRSGSISFGSARKKLGDFDSATVKGLHQYLTDQIKQLESLYGHLLLLVLLHLI